MVRKPATMDAVSDMYLVVLHDSVGSPKGAGAVGGGHRSSQQWRPETCPSLGGSAVRSPRTKGRACARGREG